MAGRTKPAIEHDKMNRTKIAPAITWLTAVALLVSMCASLTFSEHASAQSGKDTSNSARTLAESETNYAALSAYANDLTTLALRSHIETTTEQDTIVRQVIASLLVNAKAPVVVSESSLDRETIARSVAAKIASGDVAELRGKRVFRISLDALAKGAHTSDEFSARVKSIFAEAARAEGQIILFVDQLQEYAGVRATIAATAVVKETIATSHVRIIGGATSEAFSQYIVTDESLAKLFESISLDRAGEIASHQKADKRKSPIDEEFEGEKISSDMRELLRNAGPSGRVSAILQVDDINNSALTALMKRYGVKVDGRMPQFGVMNVNLPVKAIEALANSNSTNYISPDVKLESFGHVTATTGADQIRNSPGLLAGLLGATAIDGTGIGIAVLDSGIDTNHESFTNGSVRIKFSKDFTGEANTTLDSYGHGSHVASAAAGASYSNGTSFQGMAPGATIINLRVLNSYGVGTASTLLAALNWIISPADPTKAVSSTNPLNKDKYNIRIVNMSLGAPAISTYTNDPICRAARALVDAGIVVVAAAGNNGKDANGRKIYGGIHAPGNDPSVITVGAANTFATDSHADDGVATYSSRGPTRSSYIDANGVKHYDDLLKPDLIAPGNKLIFAEADSNAGVNLLVSQNPQL